MRADSLPVEPVIRVSGLSVRYPIGGGGFWGGKQRFVSAVDNLSFSINSGETLGVVGESGSGKTTTGRAVLRRVEPAAGSIYFKGQDITHASGEPLRRLRRHMQMVFQDPYASLNPRMRILDIVAEPLLVHGVVRKLSDAEERVARLLSLVGLPADARKRYADAFSGGQRQRIGIARALALEPDLIVADEPISALDVSIRAQVVNLMQDLQKELRVAYLFIAHDLSVVRHIAHRVAIMYLGKVVELGERNSIYERPKHPYTEALLSAVPIPDPELQRARRRIVLKGEIPDPSNPPKGCRFQTRCQHAVEQCRVAEPPLEEKEPNHWAACWAR
jgi:oligopeptide/dipeptide ABC transporter ATP-binding protein